MPAIVRHAVTCTTLVSLVMGLVTVAPNASWGQTRAQFDQARQQLVQEVIVGGGVTNPRVIDAMRNTPRHEFVALPLRKQAYFDMALPIGESQTISSPFIVAYMTEALDPQPTDKVLEIGTGSGYQAAVLSPLVQDVYTIEIVEPLARRAERTLKQLHYDNVHVRAGDGFQGWPEHAPFDKIIVTCSPERVPVPLAEQLREGGLMVIPVGERYQQTLYLLRKKDGKLESETLRPTLFVPMTGTAEAGRQVQPDPARPKVVNGSFEQMPDENEFLPGWYYQRQLSWESEESTPDGDHHVTFRNAEPGRSAHLLQGFPVDGRRVGQLKLSAWVRTEAAQAGNHRDEIPAVAVTFYDENRKQLGNWWLGPFLGTRDWHHSARTFRVPPAAREGILRIGLFGGTGAASFDAVELEAIGR